MAIERWRPFGSVARWEPVSALEDKEVSVSIPDDMLTVKGKRTLQTEAKDE